MKIYDISVPVHPDLPVWPGDPAVSLTPASQIAAGDTANVTYLAMSAHTGTHVDAPYHFLEDGVTLDKVPLEIMVGPAYVLHLPDVNLITAAVLEGASIPAGTRRLLFKTRNSEIWQRETDFQPEFVAISPDGAQYLADLGIRLVGVDYLSVAPYQDGRPTHEILLGAGVLIIEGLNLAEIAQGKYTLYCLPLNLQNVDGAPARVILTSP